MNVHSLYTSLCVAQWLLWCDIRLFLKDWKNNVLNALSWPFVLISINSYLLPAMGMPADYGVFTTISILILVSSFTAWDNGRSFVADLETTRSISYDLTLPLPYWMVYIKNILYFGLKSALFSLCSLMVGKLLLWNSFSFAHCSIAKFFTIYMVSNLFFGSFALWAAIVTRSVEKFGQIELRISGPLFFVCGYTASWITLYNVSPVIAHCMLLTPWIYAYEGTRGAILGQQGYLPYPVCICMLILFIILFSAHGLWSFKKTLDCV